MPGGRLRRPAVPSGSTGRTWRRDAHGGIEAVLWRTAVQPLLPHGDRTHTDRKTEAAERVIRMELEQYIGCIIMYNGRTAAVTGAGSTYEGEYFRLRYTDSETEFTVNAFEGELLKALPDPEYGILKRRDSEVLFLYRETEYTLGSQPYEPCMYIRRSGRIIRTLHNAFDAYDLSERFARGEKLPGADGKEYDRESFCKALLAAIACGRPEMDFTFAAGLSQTAAECCDDHMTDLLPEDLTGGKTDRRDPRVMDYCPNCGKKNGKGRYCTECGTKLLRE